MIKLVFLGVILAGIALWMSGCAGGAPTVLVPDPIKVDVPLVTRCHVTLPVRPASPLAGQEGTGLWNETKALLAERELILKGYIGQLEAAAKACS